MSNYLSSLLTSTTRFRNLLPASEADGDTTDDTHLCRVLRAYYTEKGRSLPQWLPPDPKSAPAAMPQKNYGGAPVGAGYGGVGAGAQGGSKLGSLWDTPSAGAKPAAQPQSLRQQRSGLGSAAGSLRSGRGVPQGGSEDAYAPRPLPSQMGGSYQGHAGGGIDRGGSPASLQQVSSAGSAQDRLKARLWGGAKSTSPGPGSMRSEPPQQQQSSYGGGGGYTSGGRNPYESQGQDKPVMSANSPWASDGGGAGGYGGSQGGYDSRRGGQAGGQRGYR